MGGKVGRLVEGLVEHLLDHVDVREVDPHVRHLHGAPGLGLEGGDIGLGGGSICLA